MQLYKYLSELLLLRGVYELIVVDLGDRRRRLGEHHLKEVHVGAEERPVLVHVVQARL